MILQGETSSFKLGQETTILEEKNIFNDQFKYPIEISLCELSLLRKGLIFVPAAKKWIRGI